MVLVVKHGMAGNLETTFPKSGQNQGLAARIRTGVDAPRTGLERVTDSRSLNTERTIPIALRIDLLCWKLHMHA